MITILIHRLHDFIMRFNSQKSSEELFWSQSEFFNLEITKHPQTRINTRSEGFFCFREYNLLSREEKISPRKMKKIPGTFF
jgi:hypothetical protein